MVAVTFVTTNAGKFREARSVLGTFGVDLRWKKRSVVEPQAEGLAEVALLKLESVRDLRG